jgi:hypothetical protein
MLAVTIDNDQVIIGERFSLSFQRTLRIPDDGKVYPLPPGLGEFPVRRVADYARFAPDKWNKDGAFIPMYQREAMWLAFSAAYWKPNALKIGVGRVNALTGDAWDVGLHNDPQDYLVCPDQPWLDGFKTEQGVVRQFVAVPLGLGYTAEAQLTGDEFTGGIQIIVYEPKPGIFPELPPLPSPVSIEESTNFGMEKSEMGVAAGGKMKQNIYPDPYGVDTWDQENFGSLDVYILDSNMYYKLTGEPSPATPISAQTYQSFQLPWFDLYDEDKGDLSPTERLTGLKSVKQKDEARGISPGAEDEPIDIDPNLIKVINPTDE